MNQHLEQKDPQLARLIKEKFEPTQHMVKMLLDDYQKEREIRDQKEKMYFDQLNEMKEEIKAIERLKAANQKKEKELQEEEKKK